MKTKRIGIFLVAGTMMFLQSCGVTPEETKVEEQDQLPLVRLSGAELKPFEHKIRIQGDVNTKQVILTAEMGGLIRSIGVKDGQRVKKGQVLATIDASILASNIQELRTQLEYAKYMLSKQEELFERGVGSEFELETARNQVKSLESKMASLSTQKGKASIKAPFSGIIDEVFAHTGEMAGPASPLMRIVNNDEVEIIASLSEKHLAKIKLGTPIEVTFPNFNDTLIHSEVTMIGNYIEPTNRTFKIISHIKDNSVLLPNMLANVCITDLNVASGLVIPSKSILKDQDNKDYVYVASKTEKGEWQVAKVIVQVIEKFEGEALIENLDEIKAGSQIVVEGAKGIINGDKVRINEEQATK